MLFTDSNIHALAWTPNNTSPDIDNNLATCISADNRPDAMTVTIASLKADSGALVSISRPALPSEGGVTMQYLRALWGIRPSKTAARLNRVYETDSILISPSAPSSAAVPGQWFDGSFQANQVEAVNGKPGVYQIDKIVSTDSTGKIKYGWADTPLTEGAIYQPDQWNLTAVDYFFDLANKKTSVLAVNGAPVPAAMQGVPANLNNWSWKNPVNGQLEPFVHFQAQLHTMKVGGYEVDYQLTAYWSDNPQFV